MKRIICIVGAVILFTGILISQRWERGNGYNGYYMGPGMMWGEGYDAGYGMMGDCWDNDDWNNNNKSNLNLTQEQQNQWDNIRNKRREYQRAVNDSLNFYAQQIHRLQSRKSNLAKEDMSYIKSILTPEQYRLFLEKLLNLN